MTITSTSLSSLDRMLYSASASRSWSMDSSLFASTPKMYAFSHSDQNFLYTALMCLKSAFFWGSYDEGNLLISFARLASATSDTWEVAAAGCRLDDDKRGLLWFNRPPTKADCCLSLAVPDVGPLLLYPRTLGLGLGPASPLTQSEG